MTNSPVCSDKQPHSSTHIGVLVRWSHWSLALLKCLYDSKQERTNPVILLMKFWVWPAQKNVLFRLPWYSLYIRHWPLTGQEQSEPEKLEAGNLQDLQVLPCWLTENLLSPRGAAFIGCCFKLICNTSKMDFSSLYFFPYLKTPNYTSWSPQIQLGPLDTLPPFSQLQSLKLPRTEFP